MVGKSARSTKPVSLHSRILGDIEARILSGEWPPGTRIPFEQDLAARYGCARMTVNKVMTQLARAGLISRRRKAGSVVVRPNAQSAVMTIREIENEVRDLGLAYRYALAERSLRMSTQEDRIKLGLLERIRVRVLALSCLHFAADQPFCLERRLINIDAVGDAESETFASRPPGAWLVERIPWTTARHVIRATGADQSAAASLDIAKGSPCLTIERNTWDASDAITHVVLTYPGDGHALAASFTPSQTVA